jgi:hypothetical protein
MYYMSTSFSLHRTTGLLLIIESLLLFAPITILGAAINWPASLDQPANIILPELFKHSTSVLLGYFIYLIYSVLFLPVALYTIRIVKGDKSNTTLTYIAIGFAIASMITRCLGIIRWLVAMPILAQIYVQPETLAASRAAINVVYQALNSYGGSIGEVLGVSLFTTLWLIIVAIEIIKNRNLPPWIGIFGLMSALLLATQLLELVGVNMGLFITVSVSTFQMWLLITGITCLLHYAKFKRLFEKSGML